MKLRESIAWVLAVLNAIAGIGIGWQLSICKADNFRAGEMLFRCGEDLEAQANRCTEEGIAYMKRGNLIFECEMRLCEVNGWRPPIDWEESAEAYREYKEQHEE